MLIEFFYVFFLLLYFNIIFFYQITTDEKRITNCKHIQNKTIQLLYGHKQILAKGRSTPQQLQESLHSGMCIFVFLKLVLHLFDELFRKLSISVEKNSLLSLLQTMVSPIQNTTVAQSIELQGRRCGTSSPPMNIQYSQVANIWVWQSSATPSSQ